MTNINNVIHSDPYLNLAPRETSVLTTTSYRHQNPRKKRTKLTKVEHSLGPSTSTTASATKPKYYNKKPDPSAPKITRPCTECGKKFWSWKALFGHMRCHPERQWRGINPPPNHRKPITPSPFVDAKQRSTTAFHSLDAFMSAEEQEVAESLLLLANRNIDDRVVCCDHEKDEGTSFHFECASCKKVFGSHQALGGHRASHKNVKGCFAITRPNNTGSTSPANCEPEEQVEHKSSTITTTTTTSTIGYHKCSICMRVFTSGQALGGHMRCHWDKFGEEASSSFSPSMLNNSKDHKIEVGSTLDLNLPAPIIKEHLQEPPSPYSSSLTLDLRLGL